MERPAGCFRSGVGLGTGRVPAAPIDGWESGRWRWRLAEAGMLVHCGNLESTMDAELLTLYHRTTPAAAAAILAGARMASKENQDSSYFSTSATGQAEGYGEAVVIIRVPIDLIELDDEFPDGEQHYRVPNAVIGQYLVAE